MKNRENSLPVENKSSKNFFCEFQYPFLYNLTFQELIGFFVIFSPSQTVKISNFDFGTRRPGFSQRVTTHNFGFLDGLNMTDDHSCTILHRWPYSRFPFLWPSCMSEVNLRRLLPIFYFWPWFYQYYWKIGRLLIKINVWRALLDEATPPKVPFVVYGQDTWPRKLILKKLWQILLWGL